MICIYSQNNTNYEANGDAVLEPISCDLEITINGAWSLTLEHPYDPEGKYEYIVEGAVIRADIRCVRELTGIRQRFRIYDYKKGLHSVTAIAFPIAMESTYDAPIDNLVIQNKTGIQAMADLQAKTNKYTLATDITKIASSSFANTNVNSAIASGSDNCFIKVWGGEILYDNLTFNVKSRIGDTEAGDHQVTYGHNLTDITYTKDNSGLITRIYPISQDGIRLNGTGYVDSPKISDYPVIHSHFIQAPYTLINTDAASPSQTAQQTRTSGAAVNTSANTLALSSYSTALAAGYEPEYIKGIRQEIIQAVQTMALSSVISTSLYNYLSGIISNAMSFMSELEQPAWDWMGSWEDGWKYGNENGYAVSRYVKIGKTWSYFNAEGYWEEPRDDSGTWDWYQAQADPGRRYGNFTHYYAHNENVYITMSGTLTKYYFDSDGWYDDSKTEASTWDWHGSGTASDPYWFGESGATSEESNKYAHDCWLFIDGSLYFFDHFGYYTPGNKFSDYQWDWVETSDGFWFGNAIDQTYGAVYLKSQWAKINGDWIYFDENGYAVQENASQSAAVEVFTTGMAGLKTVVDAQTTILYDLLYSLMTQYANSRYAAGVDVPAVTITVDMADLSKTTEYAGFENLETVKLGDAVICTDNEHNISMTSRVIGLTYDCIRDYNSTVVIGKAGASISSIVGNANSEVVTGGFDTTALEAQIAALQNKVGDIFMNDASIVSNGVGRFAIQPGSNISISRSGNTLTINSTAEEGNKVYVGADEPSPSIGGEHDIYFKYGLKTEDILSEDRFEGQSSGSHITTLTDFEKVSRNEFNFKVNGNPDGYGNGETATFTLDGLVVGNTYHISFDAQYSGSNIYFPYPSSECLTICGIVIPMIENTNKNHYEADFVYTEDGVAVFTYYKLRDNIDFTVTYTDFVITGNFTSGIEDLYDKINGKWERYEGGETYEAGDNILIENNVISGNYQPFEGTDGTEDGTSGLVPKPLATDVDKFLKSDGTWAEVEGGGGSNLIVDATRYSTEEKIIGTWIDNKPLYQKTLVISSIPSNSYDYYNFASNVDKVINYQGMVIDTSSDASMNICYVRPDNTNVQFYTQILADKRLFFRTYTSWTASAYITFYYTKTTDAVGSGGYQAYGFSPIIYSTEEREVGVWTDGKPLYQRTYQTTDLLVDNNGADISSYIDNQAEIENYINAYAVNTANPKQSANVFIGIGGGNRVVVYCAEVGRFNSFTVWYTKTADVAGSAQYTTLGVPAHHYDGNEKVVGTWFGETLYERTFYGLATNTNGDNWVNIGGIDASTWKDTVNVEIYCNSSDANNKLTRIALGEARVFNGNVQVTTSVSYNREINVATIQYTKTS